jgi:hypothetical protein
VRNFMLFSALLFLFTMVPAFWVWRFMDVPLRFYLWLIPLAVFWIGQLPVKPGQLNSSWARAQKTRMNS